MPGRLFLSTPLATLAEIAGVPADLDPDPPRANIAPGEEVLALAADGWRRMRWGIVPVGRVNARGRPVMETIINARSETLFDKSAFAGTGRAVIPADGWYEWTGAKGRKQAWSLRRRDGAPLWFAAVTDLWQSGDIRLWQVAAVTCEPSDEVRAIHHRQGVLLDPDDIPLWLESDAEVVKALFHPLPEGSLEIAQVADPGARAR